MKGEWHENRRTQCYLAEKCNGKRLMANVKKCAREGAFFVFICIYAKFVVSLCPILMYNTYESES